MSTLNARPQAQFSLAAIAFGLVGAAARHSRELLDLVLVDQPSELRTDRQGWLVMNAPAG